MAQRKIKFGLENTNNSKLEQTIDHSQKEEPRVQKLLDKIENSEVNTAFNFKYIKREKLIFSKKNDYPMEDLEKLAESILEYGLIHNIEVYYDENEDQYVIDSGERRTRVIDLLLEKYKDVEKSDSREYQNYTHYVKPFMYGYPCNVKVSKNESAIETEEEEELLNEINSEMRLIIANEYDREDDVVRTQKNIQRLSALYSKRNELLKREDRINVNQKLASDFGLNVTQVKTYKKINALIPELQTKFEENKISLSDGANYSKLTEEEQKQIVELINSGSDKKEINALYKSLEQAKKEIDEKQQKIEQISAEKNAAEEEISNLKNNQKDLKEKIRMELAAEHPDQKIIESLELEKTQIESELKKLKKSQKNKEEEQQQTIEMLRNKISNQNNLLNKNAKLVKSQIELDELVTSLKSTYERIKDALDRYNQVYSQSDGEKKTPESYNEQIKEIINKNSKIF